MSDKILVVDEKPSVRRMLAEALHGWRYSALQAGSASEARTILNDERPAAVLMDIDLNSGSSLELLRKIKRQQPDQVVIMMTGNVRFDDLVVVMREGAYDFIVQPINLKELDVRLHKAVESTPGHKVKSTKQRDLSQVFSFDQIIGNSPAIRQMLDLARKVAQSEVSCVLLQGESGTGKDCVAKASHCASRRADAPFVAINCAALPSTLIESELFGYEKGAFTDARARKEGLLEQADGGTIFLDEISELDINLQAKLLRVLEEASFRRVGGLRDVSFTARVIAASNRDLKKETKAGRFRLDLYYRLAVIQLDIPPLRDRGSDVLLLAQHFLTYFGHRLGRPNITGFSPEVASAFQLYDWPGNVRELRNVIERTTTLEESDQITTVFLPRGIAPDGIPVSGIPERLEMPDRDGAVRLPNEGISLDDVEKSLLTQALSQSGGNQTRAAELLGITRDKLRYRLKKHKEVSARQPSIYDFLAATG